ncbi:MAG: DUF799 domain-containing protein [Neisseria sp.]|nr:DUF799 domain-containing protein [Neisseria sp.]
MKLLKLLLPTVLVFSLSACQVARVTPYDYTAFKESKPKSILVLPPLNESPEVNATWGMLSATTYPLSEAGYYVFPVAATTETFKQNGLTNAADIHEVKLEKLREIFGNDAVLYITVKDYGTKYQVIQSITSVAAEAKLLDARTGKELWKGMVYVDDAAEKGSGSLLAMLLTAVIEQIAGTLSDKGYAMAQRAGVELLSPARVNGILPGPRMPQVTQQP